MSPCMYLNNILIVFQDTFKDICQFGPMLNMPDDNIVVLAWVICPYDLQNSKIWRLLWCVVGHDKLVFWHVYCIHGLLLVFLLAHAQIPQPLCVGHWTIGTVVAIWQATHIPHNVSSKRTKMSWSSWPSSNLASANYVCMFVIERWTCM